MIARARPLDRAEWMVAALLALALIAWAAALVAARHSYFGMVPATGAVASLADAVLRGQAPGHDDGSVFLKTFYLPPYPMLVAGARRLGLDWIAALRAGSVLASLLLLGAAASLARALGAGRRGALLAPLFVMSTLMFKASSLGGRADPLAVAFALLALAAWIRDPEARGWGPPAWAAASFLVKATSVAVPVAFVVTALPARRAGLARFVLRFVISAAVELLLMLPLHGPTWYFAAWTALLTETPATSSWLRGPTELVRYLGACGEIAVFAALALAQLPSRAGRMKPAFAYAGVVLLVAMIVMTNFGAGPNHLDELAAISATLAAAWAAPRLSRRSLLAALLVLVAVLGATWRDLQSPLRASRSPENRRAEVIAAVRDEPGDVLTEDALISLAAGRRPFVSDPGALRSFSLKGDPAALRIVEDIRRRRFALLVLDDDLFTSTRWYHNVHLGDLVTAAIRESYSPAGLADGRHLWRPRAASR